MPHQSILCYMITLILRVFCLNSLDLKWQAWKVLLDLTIFTCQFEFSRDQFTNFQCQTLHISMMSQKTNDGKLMGVWHMKMTILLFTFSLLECRLG